MQAKTPIAVFVYNRPEHTARMLASLEACYRLDECRVFIHSDAPSLPAHLPGVEVVREISKKWAARHHAEIIERPENLGVDLQIVSSVSALCQEYGRFIAIEDDLVLHPAFIHFMLEALHRYRDDERVALVSGYVFPHDLPHSQDTLFLPLSSAWGWATWAHAWKLFNWDAPGAQEALQDEDLRRRFNLNNTYPYSQLLIETLAKKDHRPWDILFYWAVFSNNKLGLHPTQSLVRNEGFDGSGVHFTKKWTGYTRSSQLEVSWAANRQFTWPVEVQIDEQTLRSIESFMAITHAKQGNYLWDRFRKLIALLRNI